MPLDNATDEPGEGRRGGFLLLAGILDSSAAGCDNESSGDDRPFIRGRPLPEREADISTARGQWGSREDREKEQRPSLGSSRSRAVWNEAALTLPLLSPAALLIPPCTDLHGPAACSG